MAVPVIWKDIHVRNISAGLLYATHFTSPPLLPKVRKPALIIQGSYILKMRPYRVSATEPAHKSSILGGSPWQGTTTPLNHAGQETVISVNHENY